MFGNDNKKKFHDCKMFDEFCEEVKSLLLVALICRKSNVKFLFTACIWSFMYIIYLFNNLFRFFILKEIVQAEEQIFKK